MYADFEGGIHCAIKEVWSNIKIKNVDSI